MLTPTTESANEDSFSTIANLPVNCPFKKYALSPSTNAENPCPIPHIAPTFRPLNPDFPTLGAINAAK